jgi:hypothetical protein
MNEAASIAFPDAAMWPDHRGSVTILEP